jgi:hypothetical protein
MCSTPHCGAYVSMTDALMSTMLSSFDNKFHERIQGEVISRHQQLTYPYPYLTTPRASLTPGSYASIKLIYEQLSGKHSVAFITKGQFAVMVARNGKIVDASHPIAPERHAGWIKVQRGDYVAMFWYPDVQQASESAVSRIVSTLFLGDMASLAADLKIQREASVAIMLIA